MVHNITKKMDYRELSDTLNSIKAESVIIYYGNRISKRLTLKEALFNLMGYPEFELCYETKRGKATRNVVVIV
jgi:hypothetical protein